jgi:3-dehydroquinate dehydratase II
MSAGRNRVEVMHGVNLDQLGRRNPEHYGGLSFRELEVRLVDYGYELGLELSLFQTNHEGEFVERLHRLEDLTDAVVLNPGAWTHYSWAIHDALELSGLLAVEVHLSDVQAREDWRKLSVISELCVATIAGKGVEGYREALQRVKKELDA